MVGGIENEGESMPQTRKNHPPSLKAKVAVEAIKAHKTSAQIAQTFGVHPTQVGGWKKQALAGLPEIFTNGPERLRQQAEAEKDELYKQIGQLKKEEVIAMMGGFAPHAPRDVSQSSSRMDADCFAAIRQCRTMERLDRRIGQRRDATRAPTQARSGWRPSGRLLDSPPHHPKTAKFCPNGGVHLSG
jgi:transposase